jgi:hypothetical protein
MGTVAVVVLDVDPKHLLQVSSSGDQQPVQAFDPHRPDPALGVGVGVGRLHRRQQHLSAFRTEDIVEAAGEPRIPVAERKSSCLSSLRDYNEQVAGLLDDPGAIRVGRHAGQVDPPGIQFDEEQHLQPSQPDRVDGEEVACHDPGGLPALERPPGRGRSPGRRIQPVPMQHRADGGRGDLDAEALEFALDALVARGWVLLG